MQNMLPKKDELTTCSCVEDSKQDAYLRPDQAPFFCKDLEGVAVGFQKNHLFCMDMTGVPLLLHQTD